MSIPRLTNLILALLVLLVGRGAAQGSVGVDPVVHRFAASAGQSVTQSVNVWNPFEQSVRLKVLVYLVDVEQSETGELDFPKAGTVRGSVAPWVKVNTADVVLAGKERAEVRYTVNVPAGTPDGTYWAVLMFEAENDRPPSPTELARVNVRVGHGIFVNVGKLVNTGEITGIFAQSPKTDSGTLDFGVLYQNTGNAAAQLKGYIDLRDERGQSVAKLPFEQVLSLPGRSMLLKISWLGPAPKGRYTALAVINNGNPDADVVGEHLFDLTVGLKGEQPASASSAAGPAAPGPAAPTPPATNPTAPPAGGKP